MAGNSAAWGIEIGAFAIKAIRLERDGENVKVSDFAVIPHKKVLTTPDLDRDEMVRLSLGQFISQKDLENEHLVMSVPGHAAFARFAKLPPVEPKKVPDIVKFEAVQQIPFPIEEVEWDYQTFQMEDSPEIEVGIFAITRERVQQMLSLYGELGMSPEALTLSPVAVYNAMAYDNDLKKNKGPVIFLDIGTQATDVVIAEEGRCWIRTFPLGGTHFTEAIASAFKLSYSKAEKLKLEASSSKYAKQIMQAMRPVFSDLLQDLQRSIGYYQSLHSEHELSMMVGIGSTFKIPGLRKFLGQQLQINVLRQDEYKRVSVAGREAASFSESAVNMATAYGAALQGVGLGAITANVVPVKVLRTQMWHAKTKWFAAAAAIAIVGSAASLYRPFNERAGLNPGGEPEIVRTVLARGERLKQEFESLRSGSDVGFTAENMRRLTEHRDIWPHLLHDAANALAATNPQPELLSGELEAIRGIAPEERRLVELQLLDGEYRLDGEARRIAVTMDVQLSHARPDEFLNDHVAKWLRDNAERPNVPYRIIAETVRINPSRIQTFTAGEDGPSGGYSPGGPAGGPSPREGGFGDQAPRPGGAGSPSSPGSPGPMAPPGGGGIGGPLRGGGGAAPPPPRRPPGGGSIDGISPGRGGGASPGGSSPSPIAPPSQPTDPPRSDGRDDRRADLDAMAPVPTRPLLYPRGSRYYRIPVTFEIEILDEPLPEQTEDQSTDEEMLQ